MGIWKCRLPQMKWEYAKHMFWQFWMLWDWIKFQHAGFLETCSWIKVVQAKKLERKLGSFRRWPRALFQNCNGRWNVDGLMGFWNKKIFSSMVYPKNQSRICMDEQFFGIMIILWIEYEYMQKWSIISAYVSK